LRADGLISGIQPLKSVLSVAARRGIFVLLGSIGFESFDDRILRNLNKGLSVADSLQAVRLMRDLKAEFGETFGYSSREGANHGFIHPTAWDTEETAAEIQKTIHLYGLQNDILPPHSTPLVIHHASALGDWIREIEQRERLQWPRYGSVIGWWDTPHADPSRG
jgi:fructose 1,6-bisphosphatase